MYWTQASIISSYKDKKKTKHIMLSSKLFIWKIDLVILKISSLTSEISFFSDIPGMRDCSILNSVSTRFCVESFPSTIFVFDPDVIEQLLKYREFLFFLLEAFLFILGPFFNRILFVLGLVSTGSMSLQVILSNFICI